MTGTRAYLWGFGAEHQSEALPGALPWAQNSPQKPEHGLYAEQISGSAFTAPRASNLKTWCYRIRPSVVQGPVQPTHLPLWRFKTSESGLTPEALRWSALPMPEEPCDFISGMCLYAHSGRAERQEGAAVLMYACNQSMIQRFFYNADAEMLLVPQEGRLNIHTEMGVIDLAPSEILVIPRGIKFQVRLQDALARGYVCENYGLPMVLPELGPIGANGLAHPRHFFVPQAAFSFEEGDFELWIKYQDRFFKSALSHHPLDVVAWHGNYYPYAYALCLFNTINTVSYDHPDPSIFTVLTSPSAIPGTANLDFVIFPERWMVAEHTFRPPYYHRNLMNEFMGLISGAYDAKDDGFVPGGASLHSAFTGHGPDYPSLLKGREGSAAPYKIQNTLAFMFESRRVFHVSDWAMQAPHRQKDYTDCWKNLPVFFDLGG